MSVGIGVTPELARFIELIQAGAGAVDIHDNSGVGFACAEAPVSDSFLRVEIERVMQHQKGFVRLLERFVTPRPRILDFGCSTGGGTLALALSKQLAAQLVVGIDPSGLSIRAAGARLANYGPNAKVEFRVMKTNGVAEFENGSFDLVVSVSVLEFIPEESDRLKVLRELIRLTKPRGYIFVSTPRPSLRE